MKRESTLRTRLIIVVLTAIVPLFGLSLVGLVLNTDEAVSQARTDLVLSASRVAANQQKAADATRQTLTAIANTPGLLDTEGPICERYFNTLRSQVEGYANLGMIGVDGKIRCDSLSNNALVSVADRQYFLDVMAGSAFANSGYLVGRASGKPTVVFASPVMDSTGKTGAVVFASMSLPALVITSDAPLPRGGRLLIADRFGVVLAVSPEEPSAIGKPLPGAWLLDALKTRVGGVQEGLDETGAQKIYAFQHSAKSPDAPFFIAVSADWNEIVAPAHRRLILVSLALVLVALFGSWLAWRTAGRAIVLPAARILAVTRQLEQGQLDVRVALDTLEPGGEFFLMAENFNRMADALQRRENDLLVELDHTRRTQMALKNAQQVQAESLADLRETQRKLIDAQQIGRIGHWEFDVVRQKLTWSDQTYVLFGLEPGSFDGLHVTLQSLIHPHDRDAYMQQRDQAIADNVELDVQYRIITPQGDIRWMHQLGKAHFSDAGVPLYRAGVVQEITERKNAELALAHSNAILAHTGEMAMIGGWELDVKSMQLECSVQMLRLHDLVPGSQLTAKQVRDAFVPSCKSVFVSAVQAAIDHGAPWDLELSLVTTKGRTLWVRSQGRAVMKEGVCQRLLGAMQDITAQHQSQEQLKLLQTCISRLNDIVLITEAEPFEGNGPRIIFVNDAFERHTGYTREEVLGKTPRILQGPNTSRAELDRVGAALRKWQPVRSELINYTKSGQEFWIELDIVPIADSAGRYTHWVAIERDITQRKLAEKALSDSKQRYTALFETAPVPMWVVDQGNERFLIVNSAATQTYGYSSEEFLSMTSLDICPESEHARLRKELTDAIPGSERKRAWLHRRKDGSVFPVHIFANSIQSGDKLMRFIVALDVTGQTKAEKEIQEHLFTLQRAADAAQAMTWHQTLEGTLQEVAEQARGVIGAHQAVVSLTVGNDGLPAITVVSLSSKYAAHGGQIKTPEGIGIDAMVSEGNRAVRMTQMELEAHPRWRNHAGHTDLHPSLRGWLTVPLMSRNGNKMGVLQLADKYEGDFTQQDEYVAIELAQLAAIALQNAQLIEEVSALNASLEQKVAERTVALARQEALFRALAEQAPQVVWTSDAHGALTYVNQAWFELVGGSLQDWAGSGWFKAIHPEDLPGIKTNWKQSRLSGCPFVGIRRLRAKSGVYHTMSYRAAPVLDAQANVLFWVGIDADITEVKSIEAALRLSNQELEAFSYSVSHDLRSPLNTIDGFSRLLSKQLTTDENIHVKGRHYLSRIQAGVTQMGKLIEDLLSLSQVSRMQLNYQSIDLSVMSQGILDEWCQRQPERLVQIEVQSGLQACGDVSLVGALMENLLGNAWKFTSKKPDARIGVGQVLDAAGLPVFFIRDNGAGFDMAYAEKLFIAFQRLHTETEFPGTGIGLATVSRIVGRHGGRLWAESVPEQGATFFFTLPDRPHPL